MALETLRKEITNVETPGMCGLLKLFVNLFEQKIDEMITLKNQVQIQEERIMDTEKYLSKHCSIIDNMPRVIVKFETMLEISVQTIQFLSVSLSSKIRIRQHAPTNHHQ